MPFVKEAMEGFQRETRFFATAMQWGELQQMAVFPDELGHEFGDEGEGRLQRSLVKTRIAPLVSYLTDVPDHFFSALTLIILPRSLDHPAREAPEVGDDLDWDYFFQRGTRTGPGRPRFGTIHLSANVQLFPADGQHRLKAALDAIREESSIAREEVPVVLIPFQSRDQVGQLFSDLNLNAKPVNKTVGYSLESRNPIVLLAKRLAGTIPLLQRRVNRGSNSLARSSAHVITLNGLVGGTKQLLLSLPGAQDKKALERFVAEHEEEAFAEMMAMWGVIIDAFAPHWQPVLEGGHGVPGALRDRFVFPHGLGWLALTEAAAELRRMHGDEWADIFRRTVASIDWERGNPEWEGKATVGGTVTNTSPNVRQTTQYILERAKTAELQMDLPLRAER